MTEFNAAQRSLANHLTGGSVAVETGASLDGAKSSGGHLRRDAQKTRAPERAAAPDVKPNRRLRRAKTSGGQACDDAQATSAPERAATLGMKPSVLLRRAKTSGGQHVIDAHTKAAPERAAIEEVKPKGQVRRAKSSGGQLVRDVQKNLAPERAATADVKPIDPLRRANSSGDTNDVTGAGDHAARVAHTGTVASADDHSNGDAHIVPVIGTIRELYKNRQAWHRAEKSLTLQAKAQCRRFCNGDKTEANKLFGKIEKQFSERPSDGHGGLETLGGNAIADDGDDDHTMSDTQLGDVVTVILPFLQARDHLAKMRTALEKELQKLAKQLPIWKAWCESVYGFGPLSLAAIVGSAGDLNNYATPSRLWKRMGLAVIDGGRQRRVADAIAALEHGYAPERAAAMFVISSGLIGGMGRGPRLPVGSTVPPDMPPYQRRFVNLVRQEVERVTDTWNGPEHKREPVDKKGVLTESFSKHAANRARRRVAKEFLLDLWRHWRSA